MVNIDMTFWVNSGGRVPVVPQHTGCCVRVFNAGASCELRAQPSPFFFFSSFPDLAALNLNNGSSGASDQDTLAPLPHPAAPWPLGQGYPYQYPLPPPCFPPAYQDPGFSYGSGSAGSQQSEGKPAQLIFISAAVIPPDHLLEFLRTVCAPVLWFWMLPAWIWCDRT